MYTTKRDSSHLAVPNPEATSEGKLWHRFLAPPSSFDASKTGKLIQNIRKEAVKSSTYQGSVIPYGYNCVRKEEKVVLPDGTVYVLTATWVADPTISARRTIGVQVDVPYYIAQPIANASIQVEPVREEEQTQTETTTEEKGTNTRVLRRNVSIQNSLQVTTAHASTQTNKTETGQQDTETGHTDELVFSYIS